MHRFIPAGAGNTQLTSSRHHSPPVYPRWHREHVLANHWPQVPNGLSPLARGTPERLRPFFCGWRFIPAGAGNTCSRLFDVSPVTVYPRWRGEHALLPGRRFSARGLSPLARGTLPGVGCPATVCRFIPAGAGNTVTPFPHHSSFSVYPRWRGEHNITILTFNY